MLAVAMLNALCPSFVASCLQPKARFHLQTTMLVVPDSIEALLSQANTAGSHIHIRNLATVKEKIALLVADGIHRLHVISGKFVILYRL
jgi:hypothetical protein